MRLLRSYCVLLFQLIIFIFVDLYLKDSESTSLIVQRVKFPSSFGTFENTVEVPCGLLF